MSECPFVNSVRANGLATDSSNERAKLFVHKAVEGINQKSTRHGFLDIPQENAGFARPYAVSSSYRISSGRLRMSKLLSIMFLAVAAWGQDIVLKSTFATEIPSSMQIADFPDFNSSIDINDDGIKDIPFICGSVEVFFLNPASFSVIQPNIGCGISPTGGASIVTKLRREGLAEVVCMINGIGYIRDLFSGDLLTEIEAGRLLSFDYDLDGIEDLAVFSGSDVHIYGIATGNPPISPPQELDIQKVGQDYVISWTSVPDATAYRIEWSSALDGGVRFTRIGYTTGTTFTHKNQVGQERGFDRVLSEDNGTGVLRTVGFSR